VDDFLRQFWQGVLSHSGNQNRWSGHGAKADGRAFEEGEAVEHRDFLDLGIEAGD